MSTPKRILIIDDEEGVVSYLERLLRMLGYAVDSANNGAAGLEKAADPEIALIISDMYMPGEPSQMDLIRQLREQRADCPLVVISGYPSEDRLDACRALGVTEFLTKPFEISFIKNILARLFDDASRATPREPVSGGGA